MTDQLVDETPPETTEAEQENTGRGSIFGRPLRIALLALAVVAVAAAGWTGWEWYSAAHDGKLAYAHTRDDVLSQGERGIVSLNTLDYRDVNGGFTRWLQASTGQLADGINNGRADDTKRIQDAKTVTTARVLGSSVTEVDDQAGKARMIAAVEVTVTPAQGQPAVKRSRFEAQLARTDQGWKISSLQPVAAQS